MARLNFISKRCKRMFLLGLDLALIPLALLLRSLSQAMLSLDRPCVFTLVGGKCVGCGGTHFVRDILSGNLISAFLDNPLFFSIAVYLAVSLILLNLYVLFDLKFAKSLLRVMYSVPAVICFSASVIVFFIARNLSLITVIINRCRELIH